MHLKITMSHSNTPLGSDTIMCSLKLKLVACHHYCRNAICIDNIIILIQIAGVAYYTGR